jgi:hypothetical protein
MRLESQPADDPDCYHIVTGNPEPCGPIRPISEDDHPPDPHDPDPPPPPPPERTVDWRPPSW